LFTIEIQYFTTFIVGRNAHATKCERCYI